METSLRLFNPVKDCSLVNKYYSSFGLLDLLDLLTVRCGVAVDCVGCWDRDNSGDGSGVGDAPSVSSTSIIPPPGKETRQRDFK